MVLLLLIIALCAGVLCWSLFWYALLYALSRFCNQLGEGEKSGCFALIVFLLPCYCLCSVPWIGLQCVIVVFHDHTQLLFEINGLRLDNIWILNSTPSKRPDAQPMIKYKKTIALGRV